MEEQYQMPIEEENTPNNTMMKIIIAQAICVFSIIALIFIIKLFFGKTYKKIEKWYNENICYQTTISEILETSSGDSNEV